MIHPGQFNQSGTVLLEKKDYIEILIIHFHRFCNISISSGFAPHHQQEDMEHVRDIVMKRIQEDIQSRKTHIKNQE